MFIKLKKIFQADFEYYQGVSRAKIYLLRLLYSLMFIVLGIDVWSYIFSFQGVWEPGEAMKWSVWASFSALAGLGIIHPLRMLPILLLEIFYKLLWLLIVAYPLWLKDELIGSSAEGMTNAFLWVILAIIAVPWKFVFKNYFLKPKQVVRHSA
ncbi:MAG: hypothetical protein JKY14_09630 [Paraglaciecola sp.]|nr:hypothetical protein [Paraglaciecola sp.]